MRTPLPTVTDLAQAALDGPRRGRADEPAWSPGEGLFLLTSADQTLFGRFIDRPLGAARLIDLSAATLALADDPRAAEIQWVLVQAVIEGALDLAGPRGGHAALRAGHVIIRSSSPDTVLTARAAARVVTLAMPRHLLIPRFVPSDAIIADGAVFHTSLAGRLLYGLVAGLTADGETPPASPPAILDAVAALVGLCLAERPPAPVSLSALAAARSDEIIRYLERNYANAALTPASMAEDLGISVRYAHKLLEQTGRSFRQELIGLRLKAARRAFADAARPRQTIADIAISVGFNDLSQFNRHFRQAYAMTPRAARQADEQAATGAPSPPSSLRAARREAPFTAAPEPPRAGDLTKAPT